MEWKFGLSTPCSCIQCSKPEFAFSCIPLNTQRCTSPCGLHLHNMPHRLRARAFPAFRIRAQVASPAFAAARPAPAALLLLVTMLAWPKQRKHPEKPELPPALRFAPCLAASSTRQSPGACYRPLGARSKTVNSCY